MASERLNDVRSVLDRLTESEKAFDRFGKVYVEYRDAVQAKWPVVHLLPMNERFRDAKRAARESFQRVSDALSTASEKYTGDAMAEVFESIYGEITRWNRDSVKAHRVSLWMREFSRRVQLLHDLGDDLNGSEASQEKVKQIAAEPFDPSLKPAGRTYDAASSNLDVG